MICIFKKFYYLCRCNNTKFLNMKKNNTIRYEIHVTTYEGNFGKTSIEVLKYKTKKSASDDLRIYKKLKKEDTSIKTIEFIDLIKKL